MGNWGTSPWDNDAAADWFAAIMERTKFADSIEDALNLKAVEYADEIRAAASILVLMGRTYVWPVKKLELHLNLAINRLTEILENPDFEDDEELRSEIRYEIEILKTRIPQSDFNLRSETEKHWSSWIK